MGYACARTRYSNRGQRGFIDEYFGERVSASELAELAAAAEKEDATDAKKPQKPNGGGGGAGGGGGNSF